MLPGWEHGSLDASVVCVMREVAKRMGTRVTRKAWDRKLGRTVYGVLTRKDREAEHKHKMRMKMNREMEKAHPASGRRSDTSPLTCAVM